MTVADGESLPSRPESAGSVLPAAVLLPGFTGLSLPDWLADRLREGLAGVCLFGGNIASRRQLRDLTDAIRAANPSAVIAVDEEGGDVTRLYYDRGSPYPGPAILGRIDDLSLTEEVGRAVGLDLGRSGVTLDFAPDADVNSDPLNPVIGVRSFGSEPAHVGRHTASFISGLQSAGVAACAKHFPGHGDTTSDSHHALPVVDLTLGELRDRELLPFTAAVAAGAKAIMTSHILLPRIDERNPATFSGAILGALLRDELGFEGVIVSDALDMAGASAATGIPEAAVRALSAGCDLLCIGTDTTEIELAEIERAVAEAMAAGRLERGLLERAGTRIRSLAEWSASLRMDVADDRDEPEFDLARTARSFEVAASVTGPWSVWPVLLETTPNMAIGDAPWGPFSGDDGWVPAQVLRRDDELRAPGDGCRLWLIGRDNHRHDWVRRIVDEARLRYPDVVVVDMGWPDDERRYADIATYGASRHAGDALRSLEVAR